MEGKSTNNNVLCVCFLELAFHFHVLDHHFPKLLSVRLT